MAFIRLPPFGIAGNPLRFHVLLLIAAFVAPAALATPAGELPALDLALPVGGLPVPATGVPSVDPSEPTRLLGGEVLVYQFDADDFDTLHVGSVLDHSGFGQDGTRINGLGTTSGPNGFGSAMTTSMNNGRHLRVNSFDGLRTITADYTVMGWVYLDNHCCWSYIFSMAAQNGAQLMFPRVQGNDVQTCTAAPSGSMPCFGFGYTLPLNAWTHVAYVQRGADLSLVVNGETWRVLTHAPGFYTASPVATANLMMHYATGESFIGRLDEFRVYNRALTNEEIQSVKDFPYVHLNDAPVLDPVGNRQVAEETTLAFEIGATDPQGDPLTFSASGLPEGATFDPETRAFSWTPTFAQAGNHAVTFTVSDGEAADEEAIVVSVGNVNRPPELAPVDPLAGEEGAPLSVQLSASDPDGDGLSFSLVDGPAGATVSAGGLLTWTPTFDQAGGHVLTVAATDGDLSDAVTVEVTVANVNRAPVASAGDDVALPCAGPLTPVPLDGRASNDPDGDALGYGWSSLDGAFDDPTQAVATARFRPGLGLATLTVADGETVASDDVLVRVLDEGAPTLDAVFPSAAGVYAGGLHLPAGDDVLVVGAVDVSAGASDACSPIARVTFRVDDGTEVVDEAAPFGFTYAPAGAGVQYRRLSVVATDATGNDSAPVVVDLAVVAVAPRT